MTAPQILNNAGGMLHLVVSCRAISATLRAFKHSKRVPRLLLAVGEALLVKPSSHSLKLLPLEYYMIAHDISRYIPEGLRK